MTAMASIKTSMTSKTFGEVIVRKEFEPGNERQRRVQVLMQNVIAGRGVRPFEERGESEDGKLVIGEGMGENGGGEEEGEQEMRKVNFV